MGSRALPGGWRGWKRCPHPWRLTVSPGGLGMEPAPQFWGRNPPDSWTSVLGRGFLEPGWGGLGELCCVLGFKFAAPLLLRWQRGRCGGTGEGLDPPPRDPLVPAVVGSKRNFAMGPCRAAGSGWPGTGTRVLERTEWGIFWSWVGVSPCLGSGLLWVVG